MPFTNPLEGQWKFAEKLFGEWSKGEGEPKEVLQKVPTPTLVMRKTLLENRYGEVEKHFDHFRVYYAVKANDDEGVIKTFADRGSGFEVASIAELQKVFKLSLIHI